MKVLQVLKIDVTLLNDAELFRRPVGVFVYICNVFLFYVVFICVLL